MIVHLTDVFAPRVGGIEVQIERLARAQTAAGEEVHVITTTSGTHDDRALPYRVHRVARVGHVRALLLRLEPRVAHVHLSVYSPFALCSTRQLGLLRIPTVMTVHSMWDLPVRVCYRLIGKVGDWRDRFVLTAVSTVVADQIARALPGTTTVVVPNGVSPVLPRSTSRPTGELQELHVVSVGRLVTRRKPLILLKVLRQAQQRLDGQVAVHATIVGAGSRTDAMRRYLSRHGMTGWVRLIGVQDQQTIRDILATADVYLNVTRREAFGLATLEARTAGLPVVARSDSGVADFVEHGREGLLGDTMTDLVAALVQLGCDKQLHHRIATHNRTVTPSEHSWSVVLNSLRHCYDEAVRRVHMSDPTAAGKDV
ncbi:glycosyltransferase family 4 protein [Nocardia sp. NPDC101769]|uniref:glycosyltransferase family 4 protein n=1 Tax=Nocardia sp. NPDC101769 TaxID=3364333 RepID=UPI0037FFEA2B